ncbi:ABC transporter ATP-binding protein [Tistrella mobilis]|uniref:ABC transporter ATP-binding protein n=1 Tax=Tistrella mobilis TaxID=171437 RepID=UPI0031F61579
MLASLVPVAALAVVSALLMVLVPWLFARLIDDLVAGRAEDLLAMVAAYALLLGCGLVVRHAVEYLGYMGAERISSTISIAFFERLMRKTPAFFVDNNIVAIRQAQARGAMAMNVVVQLGSGVLLTGLVQFLATIVMLGAAVTPAIAAIVAAYGLAFTGVTWLAASRTRGHLDAAIDADQQVAQVFGNVIGAVEAVRQVGGTAWARDHHQRQMHGLLDRWAAYCRRRIAYAAIYGVALALQIAITFALLLPAWRAGQLTIGEVVLFNTLLLQLNQPFEAAGHAIDDVVRSLARLRPLLRMWQAPEMPIRLHAQPLVIRDGAVTFDHLGYVHADGRGLSGLRATARRGHVTWIMGETGAGKTTFMRLLTRALEPGTGRILIDGTDLAGIDPEAWYAIVGIVPQEPVLIADSVAMNVTFGRLLDEGRLNAALAAARMLERVQAMPAGLETVVGERGFRLSGGERQRIAIARALYGDPAVLLLDEAGSALDPATEENILDGIRQIVDRVTVIAVTHRPGVIRPGDTVITLASGRSPVVREDI